MKATRKLLVLYVSVATLSQIPSTELQAYQCDGQACCQEVCECERCCNSGLLDSVDGLFGRIQKQVHRTSRIVASEFGILRPIRNRNCSSSCDEGCDACGSCSRPPTVSGSMGTSSAHGCQSCQDGAYAVDSTVDDSAGSQPVPPPLSDSLKGPSSRIFTKKVQEQPMNRLDSSTRPRPTITPSESSTAPWNAEQPQRLPDSQVDPFEDESQSNSPFKGASGSSKRAVQGRTIQYRRNSGWQGESQQPSDNQPVLAPSYRQRFDPQASNSAYSADYWAGSQEVAKSNSNRVELASDQSPTLQQIHKRAYSLKLADAAWDSQSNSRSVDEVDESNVQLAPARLPSAGSPALPLKAPVQQVLRLKAQPATGFESAEAPVDNPLR